MQERKSREDQLLQTKKNMLIKQNESQLELYKSSLMNDYNEKTRKKRKKFCNLCKAI